jgi:hypothetical protein
VAKLLLDAHFHLWEFSLVNAFVNLEQATSIVECSELMLARSEESIKVGIGYNPIKVGDEPKPRIVTKDRLL